MGMTQEARTTRDEIYDRTEYNDHHKAKLSHELIGGAAAFEAMHLWEKKQRESGQEVKHSFAKEALAGLAGAEIDRLVETKGLDFVDREKAKHHAKKQVEDMYDAQYGEREHYSPHHQPHDTMRDYDDERRDDVYYDERKETYYDERR
ncbi:hypothetical protein B0H67DRAFT_169481 [Lasiosphaeris hirsuta]|uniref:CipC-like antibiotic response protein n=1 Tax=Lasiosphaeris hirsuta TaxID=260670 RepID=A0AA40AQ42_9PEZI|nr:hypothetical protein B0H67DRAFT_169481 [Lasiosphaeris hirsuta]